MSQKDLAKAFDDLDRALYNRMSRLQYVSTSPFSAQVRVKKAVYATARTLISQAKDLLTNIDQLETE